MTPQEVLSTTPVLWFNPEKQPRTDDHFSYVHNKLLQCETALSAHFYGNINEIKRRAVKIMDQLAEINWSNKATIKKL